MDQLRNQADWSFMGKRPFGLLMLWMMVLPNLIFLGIVFAPFVYEGMSYVRTWSLVLFLLSAFFNLAHVMGWNRRALYIRNAVLYVPFTLMVFFTCLLYMLLYAFATLLSLISFFDSLHFSIRLIITYLLITILCAALTYVLARLCILIYRASPNSKLLQLATVVIDGEKAQRMDAGLPTTGQFTPAGGATPVGGAAPTHLGF